VHGRTRQQFYKGEARWDRVRAVVESVDVPVVVNGDITSLDAARTALELSGAAAVMIGRGAQGRPWIIGQIGAELDGTVAQTAPVGDELSDLVTEHYEGILSEYGVDVGVRAARKHLDWYLEASGIDAGKASRSLLLNSLVPRDVIALIRDIFGTGLKAAA
jgi:tRNA-dihydrouridine synthase B